MDLCRGIVALGCSGLLAAAATAQWPTPEAETTALAAIRAQRTDGLIAVQPWAQWLDAHRLGVGWLTSRRQPPADAPLLSP